MSGNEREPEPRWLEPHEMHAWLSLVETITWLPSAFDTQLQRDAGITHFEYLALSALSEAEEHRLLMRELADAARGSLSRLSHVVSRLEKRGWVKRALCPTDGRSTYAVLTPQGYQKVTETAPGYVESVRRLVIDRLTATDLKNLATIGQRLTPDVDQRP